MTLSDLEVVRVVCRSDLNDAGTEFSVYVFISDDRDLSVHEGKPYIAADQIIIAVILRVNCNCGIAEHSLGTCSCKLQESGLGN